MKTIILAILLALIVSPVLADCEGENYEYGKARSAYNNLIYKLLPKIKAGKKLTKKEQKKLDKANMRVYNAKINLEACSGESEE